MGQPKIDLYQLVTKGDKVFLDTSILCQNVDPKDERKGNNSFQQDYDSCSSLEDVSLPLLRGDVAGLEQILEVIRENSNCVTVPGVKWEFGGLIKYFKGVIQGLSQGEELSPEDELKIQEFKLMKDRLYSIWGRLGKRTLDPVKLYPEIYPTIHSALDLGDMHRPVIRHFRKKAGYPKKSRIDLRLVAAAYCVALRDRESVVILANDFDVVNLVYNFGRVYRYQNVGKENMPDPLVTVFFPEKRGWVKDKRIRFLTDSKGAIYTRSNYLA